MQKLETNQVTEIVTTLECPCIISVTIVVVT